MSLGKRGFKIETFNYSEDAQIEMGQDVISCSLINECEGASTFPTYGWNERANNSNLVETSIPFGLGWPYVMVNQKLYLSFTGSGTKKCKVIIYRDAGAVEHPSNNKC